jgi:hypothetical protein
LKVFISKLIVTSKNRRHIRCQWSQFHLTLQERWNECFAVWLNLMLFYVTSVSLYPTYHFPSSAWDSWKYIFADTNGANWEENGDRCFNWEKKLISYRESKWQNMTTQKLNFLAQHPQFFFWCLPNTRGHIHYWKTKNLSSNKRILHRLWKPKFRNLTPPSLGNFVHILKFTIRWLFNSSYSLFNTTCFGLTVHHHVYTIVDENCCSVVTRVKKMHIKYCDMTPESRNNGARVDVHC